MLARVLFAAVALCLIGTLPDTHSSRAMPAARGNAPRAAPGPGAASMGPAALRAGTGAAHGR